MRVGIIGCGYVGLAVAKYWKKEGHVVSVTTRQADRKYELQNIADFVFVLNSGNLEPFLNQQDSVLVCVAPDTSDYISTYLKTAENIKRCWEGQHSLKQLIYTSSTSVYSERQGSWVDEHSPLDFVNPQSSILAETEKIFISCESPEHSICILRLGGIYGPGREIHERLRRMQGNVFPGTGNSFTNLVHLEDIVRVIDFSLEKHLSGIYNVCQDDHLLRKELYDQLCSQYNLPPAQWNPQIENSHGGNKRVSNQKIKDLGFHFQVKSFKNAS